MRLRRGIGWLLAVTMVTGACGDDKASTVAPGKVPASSTSTSPVTTAVASTSSTSVVPQDPAKAARAKSAVVQAADLPPGWTPKAEGDRLDHETTWRDLTRCLGVEDSGQGLAKAESPAFGLGVGTQVNSAVEYLPAANVQALATAFAAPKLTDCAKQAFSADVKRNAPEGATVGAVDVVPLEFAKLGQQASAFRATTKLDLGFPIDIYQDFVFVFKADSVSRVSFLNPGAPFQPELQRALVEAVVGRA